MMKLLTLAILMNILFVPRAFAYLDPGAGSLLLQGIIAAIAGGALFARQFWSQIRSLFGSLLGKSETTSSDDENDSKHNKRDMRGKEGEHRS